MLPGMGSPSIATPAAPHIILSLVSLSIFNRTTHAPLLRGPGTQSLLAMSWRDAGPSGAERGLSAKINYSKLPILLALIP
jgi:hypothetical protein